MEHFYNKPHMGENYFTFAPLYKAMVDSYPAGSRFVEVGTYKGMSASFMAVEIINSNKDIKFDCVDNWSNEVYAQYFDNDANIREIFKTRDGIGDRLFETYNQNIEPVKDVINTIKAVSWEAPGLYEDNSLQFVFIDADHSYESCVRDINAWLPKIAEGGVLAGHDYAWHKPVRDAVDTVFGQGVYHDPWNNGCFAFKKVNGQMTHLKQQVTNPDKFVYRVV